MTDPNKPENEQEQSSGSEGGIPGRGTSGSNPVPPPVPNELGTSDASGEQKSGDQYYTYEKPAAQPGEVPPPPSQDSLDSSGYSTPPQYSQASGNSAPDQNYQQQTQDYPQQDSNAQNQFNQYSQPPQDQYGGYDQQQIHQQQANQQQGYQQQGYQQHGYPQQGYQQPYYQQAPASNDSSKGIIALVLSVLGLVFALCCVPLGLGFSIAGMVMGRNAAKLAKDQGRSDVVAEIAFYLGIVSLVITIANFVFGLVMMIVNPNWAEEMFQGILGQ